MTKQYNNMAFQRLRRIKSYLRKLRMGLKRDSLTNRFSSKCFRSRGWFRYVFKLSDYSTIWWIDGALKNENQSERCDLTVEREMFPEDFCASQRQASKDEAPECGPDEAVARV